MTTVEFIGRLEGVKSTWRGRWIARCPAHGDRRPSLSVREANGRNLVCCFGGCDIHAVVDALGLSAADLFQLGPTSPESRNQKAARLAAGDALACLAHESAVVLAAANDVARGQVLDDGDRARLAQAVGRIMSATEICNG